MFSQAFTQIQASDGLVNPITTKDDAEDIKAEENFNKWYEDLAPNCIEDELQRIYEKHFKEKEPFKKLLSDLIERIIEPSIPKDYVEDFKSTLGALVLDHIQIYVQDKIQTYVQDKIKNDFQNEVRESFNSDQADIQNEIEEKVKSNITTINQQLMEKFSFDCNSVLSDLGHSSDSVKSFFQDIIKNITNESVDSWLDKTFDIGTLVQALFQQTSKVEALFHKTVNLDTSVFGCDDGDDDDVTMCKANCDAWFEACKEDQAILFKNFYSKILTITDLKFTAYVASHRKYFNVEKCEIFGNRLEAQFDGWFETKVAYRKRTVHEPYLNWIKFIFEQDDVRYEAMAMTWLDSMLKDDMQEAIQAKAKEMVKDQIQNEVQSEVQDQNPKNLEEDTENLFNGFKVWVDDWINEKLKKQFAPDIQTHTMITNHTANMTQFQKDFQFKLGSRNNATVSEVPDKVQEEVKAPVPGKQKVERQIPLRIVPEKNTSLDTESKGSKRQKIEKRD